METDNNDTMEQRVTENLRLLRLLARSYPNVAAASREIINLQAIMNLPKGTEHFLADIHGEYEAFQHVLKNASGDIKRKVTELFEGRLTGDEIKELCTLIYYPEQKLELMRADAGRLEDSFYNTTLLQLVEVCRTVSAKYTRSKVRKELPDDYAYIIEELLHESTRVASKKRYVESILNTILEIGRAEDFIIEMCLLIQRLSIDRLHILGDVFDRGPGAHIIMDTLCHYHNLDIQWGNHDVLWMGAFAGNDCCIANVLRLSLRYGNMATLEDGYGINLVPLATFAMQVYADDPCDLFGPKLDKDDTTHNQKTRRLIAQMHKAISIIQFKLEADLIDRRPEWGMQDRKCLEGIDFARGIYSLNGVDYDMKDTFFPTVDPEHPNRLTAEEEELVKSLHHSFRVSDKLKKHIRFFLTHGCMYGIYNNNLLFHASVPLNEDGSLKDVDILGEKYRGKELLHKIGMVIRSAFNQDTPVAERTFAKDYFWYLWCGKDSPLFDKSKMATFERYFLKDRSTYEEQKGWYYRLRDDEHVCDTIMDAFGVTGKHRHIINGHVPVRTINGESPIKANGKLMVIDGGFAKAYHNTTGIAGYTLVFHSRGFSLVQHEPFTSAREAIRNGTDIKSTRQIVEMSKHRMLVMDTDTGRELAKQIAELKALLYAYRHGILKENVK